MVITKGGRCTAAGAFTRFPPRRRSDAAAIRGSPRRSRAHGARAPRRGFDSGLAPVLDCLFEPASTVIGERAFGASPDAVAACGVAFVEAALSEGVVPVRSTSPGWTHALDSHHAVARGGSTIDELAERRPRALPRRGRGRCPAVLVGARALSRARPVASGVALVGRHRRRPSARTSGFSGSS